MAPLILRESKLQLHEDEVDGSWVESPSLSDAKFRNPRQFPELEDVTSLSPPEDTGAEPDVALIL